MIDGFCVREVTSRAGMPRKVIDHAEDMIDKALSGVVEPENTATYLPSINSIRDMDAFLDTASAEHMFKLRDLLRRLSATPEYPVLSVHDSFRSSPKFMGNIAGEYREVLAQLTESRTMENILRELSGDDYGIADTQTKIAMAEEVRQSQFSLS